MPAIDHATMERAHAVLKDLLGPDYHFALVVLNRRQLEAATRGDTDAIFGCIDMLSSSNPNNTMSLLRAAVIALEDRGMANSEAPEICIYPGGYV